MSLRCDLCSRDFKSSSALRSHNNSTSRHPHRARCERCARSFVSESALQTHLANSGAHAEARGQPVATSSNVNSSAHNCFECGQNFSTRAALLRHIDVHINSSASNAGWESVDSDRGASAYDWDAPASDWGAAVGRDWGMPVDYDWGRGSDWGAAIGSDWGVPASAFEQMSEYLLALQLEESVELATGRSDPLPGFVRAGTSTSSQNTNSSVHNCIQCARQFKTRTALMQHEGSAAHSNSGASNAGSSQPLPSSMRAGTSTSSSASAKATLESAGNANSGYMCPLCLDRSEELSSVKCGHVFCTSCIRCALEERRQCPLCRMSAQPSDLRRTFFST